MDNQLKYDLYNWLARLKEEAISEAKLSTWNNHIQLLLRARDHIKKLEQIVGVSAGD